MFERFTDAARSVMADALTLAQQQHSPAIRRHHLLYALLEDAEERPDSVPALMLTDAGVDTAVVKATVLVSLKDSEAAIGDAERDLMPYSSGAKKAIELGLREALSLGHNYIGTEHLLLAILRSADGPLARTLEATPLRYGNAREFLRTYSPPSRGGRRGRGGGSDFGPLIRREIRRLRRNDAVDSLFERAGRRTLNERPITTGDLLVALAEQRGTHFARLLDGVALPSPSDLAAAAQKLVDDNVPDGEPETVRVDPRSGAVTVTDPDLAEKLKSKTPDQIAEALRRLAEE